MSVQAWASEGLQMAALELSAGTPICLGLFVLRPALASGKAQAAALANSMLVLVG